MKTMFVLQGGGVHAVVHFLRHLTFILRLHTPHLDKRIKTGTSVCVCARARARVSLALYVYVSLALALSGPLPQANHLPLVPAVRVPEVGRG